MRWLVFATSLVREELAFVLLLIIGSIALRRRPGFWSLGLAPLVEWVRRALGIGWLGQFGRAGISWGWGDAATRQPMAPRCERPRVAERAAGWRGLEGGWSPTLWLLAHPRPGKP